MDIAEKTLRLKTDFDDVYEAGKKAEYDAFWDSFNTQNTQQMYQFTGSAWNDTTFKPKSDIIAIANAGRMFALNACTNIKKTLNECGKRLDLSQCTSFEYTFYYAETSELPEINMQNATTASNAFRSAKKLVTIDKLVMPNRNINLTGVFDDCTALENITIEGTIGQNTFDIHWSTMLSADSLKSIINALSTTTTGLTVTLPSTAQANYEAVYGSGSWATLTATRSNWTIAYA